MTTSSERFDANRAATERSHRAESTEPSDGGDEEEHSVDDRTRAVALERIATYATEMRQRELDRARSEIASEDGLTTQQEAALEDVATALARHLVVRPAVELCLDESADEETIRLLLALFDLESATVSGTSKSDGGC